jgi:uncharacterized protein with HEPN domain
LRDDRVYLDYVVEAIEAVERYLSGPAGPQDEQLFVEDALRRDAVLHRLETLADAAGHLSESLKERHPNLSWRRISDFRNVLAHAYTRVDLDLVWRVIVVDVPVLKALAIEELERRSGP